MKKEATINPRELEKIEALKHAVETMPAVQADSSKSRDGQIQLGQVLRNIKEENQYSSSSDPDFMSNRRKRHKLTFANVPHNTYESNYDRKHASTITPTKRQKKSHKKRKDKRNDDDDVANKYHSHRAVDTLVKSSSKSSEIVPFSSISTIGGDKSSDNANKPTKPGEIFKTKS